MSFESDVKKIAKKTDLKVGQVVRGIKVELFNSVVMDTRVDTGRMRGNWQAQEGYPILTETGRFDKTGAKVSAEIRRTVKPGAGVSYLTNNVPYAERYERIDAMMGKNIARIEQIVHREAKKL